jgi:hypothetical protein
MKLFNYILSVIAILLVIFNFTRIDFSDPFHNESIVAVITVISGLCVVILLAILRISKKIENIQKRK